MIIAGLTGTIGTGKSAVSAMFRELGAFIIDADKLAHEVVEPGKKGLARDNRQFWQRSAKR